ncbi:winged helix DNA-binding domain-containing protein [Streptomyces sp. H10-C2]|uniref:winged helix DNA-binding domain-containing protein n=1 Tax=unclassified Streptomyces TaxID=2593676 RepID=UPI0024BB7BB1|nr:MULTISPECIES: winged helix DNA-binding domain-containing protein [unclassified Streptomyces]MDJ0344289.1 winged helix DNA-binding domain-containing protein [Streptomyces sp. PH10-H1]MDJ0373658.1 winged helix DNA-binding domain-containing protein [Streptomyces sp. H10-C2]
MLELTPAQVRSWRVQSQGLAGPRNGVGAVGAARGAGALQAQDAKACRLQVRARSAGLTAGDVDAACGAGARALVRTWLMRGTLHAVPARDARWMTLLLGPRVAAAQRGRRLRLGLDEETCARALPALEQVLAGRPPLLRDELVRGLGEFGITLDPRSQAPAHLLLYAAAVGLVCRGPEAEGDKSTYVLREEWLDGIDGPEPTGAEALAALAERYVAAYGPTTEADFARWSGLPIGQARSGFRAAGEMLAEVSGPDGPLWVTAGAAAPADPAPSVRLIGHFDPYLLGYRDRDPLLDPSFAHLVATGGGFITPCVLLDGEVVGIWRHERGPGERLTVRVDPFRPFRALGDAVVHGIEAEVADLGRFLGVDAAWERA